MEAAQPPGLLGSCVRAQPLGPAPAAALGARGALGRIKRWREGSRALCWSPTARRMGQRPDWAGPHPPTPPDICLNISTASPQDRKSVV